ncbi:MAG: TolC family protein [Bacteroidales bacterium]|jgi:outer membrane protein TolC|nr:TolC family protein [Bacteroidales bacterium]
MKQYKSIMMLIAVLSYFSVATAQSDSLNRYLQTAAQNNPGVKAGFLAYQAALQKIPQAGAYQDPQLEMGFFLQPMEIVGGRQTGQFQLMQMFPWFGTRKAARTEAQHMAKMAFEQFREMRDNIFLEVYTQWYALCSLQQKLKNSRENAALLKQLETLALQKFKSPVSSSPAVVSQRTGNSPTASSNAGNSSGGMSGGMNMRGKQAAGEASNSSSGQEGMSMGETYSGMSETLRIQLEISELESNIESILSEMHVEKIRFNALLNRHAETEIAVPDSISQIPFAFDEETAMNLMIQRNPMLGMIGEESLAYEAKAEMDRKMGYPMFGIGLQYMLIGKTSSSAAASDNSAGHGATQTGDNMSSMNGKDMIMPMLSLSIPIFRGKYKALRRETELLRQASDEKYADAFNMLQAELYRAKHQLDDAMRKIILYRKQTELAQTAYNIALQEFISGKNELGSIIQVQRQLLDYKFKIAEATVEYNTKAAAIQKILNFEF